MAWPPLLPPTGRTNATPQSTNHPDDHNRTAAALVEVLAKIGNPNPFVAVTPTGTAGRDFVDVRGTQAAIVARMTSAARLEVGASSMVVDAESNRLILTGGPTGNPYLQATLTGVGNPSHFLDIGSRNPQAEVVIRFLNVDRIESSVPWPVASSANIKSDIVDAPDADVLPLRPVRYQRTDGVDEGRTLLGLIAEEVAEVIPEAAVRNLDGAIVGYTAETVLAATIATIQRLAARVDALEQNAAGR